MNNVKILNENGKIFLKGPMSEADVRNRNGRIYPRKVLAPAIFALQEKIDNGEDIWSELEHPPYAEPNREKACGRIVEVHWSNTYGRADCKVEVLSHTPQGKKLIETINEGGKVGISTRAQGSLNEDGVVQPGLEIKTADIVAIPSCQICYLTENDQTGYEDNFLDIENNQLKANGKKCIFKKLSLSEQLQVREKIVNSIIGIFSESKEGTYVSVKVKNAKELSQFFNEQGLETIAPGELHTTIAFSRKKFDHKVNEDSIYIKPQKFKEITTLGDEGAIVLKLESPELQRRFYRCMKEGATYDYDSYMPHITLTYKNPKGIKIEDLEMPNFPIILYNEKVEPLDLNWKDKVE